MHKLLAALAVATAAVTPVAMPTSAPASQPGPLLIDYTLQASGSDAPLVQGQMALEPGRSAAFERRSRNTMGLQLEALPEPSGVLVRVGWEEKDDHDQLHWTPAVMVRPGEPAVAVVSWSGGSRTLKLSLR
jgi:hypothetical protein